MKIKALITNRQSGKSTIANFVYEINKSNNETILITYNDLHIVDDNNIISIGQTTHMRLHGVNRKINLIILDEYCQYYQTKKFKHILSVLYPLFNKDTKILIISSPNKSYFKSDFDKIKKLKTDGLSLDDSEIKNRDLKELYDSLLTNPNVEFIDNKNYLNYEFLHRKDILIDNIAHKTGELVIDDKIINNHSIYLK